MLLCNDSVMTMPSVAIWFWIRLICLSLSRVSALCRLISFMRFCTGSLLRGAFLWIAFFWLFNRTPPSCLEGSEHILAWLTPSKSSAMNAMDLFISGVTMPRNAFLESLLLLTWGHFSETRVRDPKGRVLSCLHGWDRKSQTWPPCRQPFPLGSEWLSHCSEHWPFFHLKII